MFTTVILFIFRAFNRLYSVGMIRTYLFFYDLYKYYSDYKDIQRIKSIISRGSIVIDAGANVGFYTLLFSDIVGETGRVIAFEPNDKNFDILKRRTKNRNNVTAVNAALSDKSGFLDLYISEDLNVDHQTYDIGESRKKVQIKAYSLDDYCIENAVKVVSLIKMDLQGFDAIALKGMKKIIRMQNHISVSCEFWPYGMKKAGIEPEEMISSLGDLGLETKFKYSGKNEYGYYETLWLTK